MFEWTSSGGIQAAVWAVIIGGFIGGLVIIPFVETLKEFLACIGVLMGWYVFIGVITFLASFATTPYANTNTRFAAQQFGLRSDTAYPLILGSRIGSVQAEASADAGFFFASAVVSAKPASILSVGFVHGNRSYILELPTGNITFVQSSTARPSVSMHLRDDYFDGVREVYHYGGTDCHFKDLFFVCPPKRMSTTIKVLAATNRRGLAPIVNDSLDSAVITLTPKMYQSVLGTP